MKLDEALKALDENPKKVFGCVGMRLRAVSGAYKFENVITGKREFGIGIGNNWQEIDISVTWQEALEAWAFKGKTIRCTISDLDYIYKHESNHSGDVLLIESYGDPLELDEIKFGTWYIED